MKLSSKEVKKLDNDILLAVKEAAKSSGYRKRAGIFYKVANDYFVQIMIYITGMQKDKVIVRGTVKPFVADDVLWDVLQMPSNHSEPISLRANGAWTIWGLPVFEETTSYENSENISSIAQDFFIKCNEAVMAIVENFRELSDFINYSESYGKWVDFDSNRELLLINAGDYQAAKEIAQEQIRNHVHGRFQTEKKWVNEHIVDYCDTALTEVYGVTQNR
ncbi:MAG: hypothetical protein LBV19_07345 [Streptococcaceae bacterium]|nr:hypothetical protein [Streptococcaceae bacterium]